MSVWPSEQELQTTAGNVVAAVEIQRVTPAVGTRGKPPRVSLRIDALIRGTIAQRSVEALWQPPDLGGDGESEARPSAPWLAEPLTTPPPGTRLIVLLTPTDDGSGLQVANRCRYPDTPQVRKQVRKAIADYLVFARRSHRERAEEARVARAAVEARRSAWRAQGTPERIAQSARDADFVGIGHLVSGPNGARATFRITEILRGTRRATYLDSAYFADVDIPPAALGVVDSFYWSELAVVLFLTENGMDLIHGPYYPLTGLGMVLADAEARRIARDAVRTSQRRPLPFCVATIEGYAGLLSADDNRALQARIADTLARAGRARCNVARASGLYDLTSPDAAGGKIRETFPGASRVVQVSIDNRGAATLSGLRISSDHATVVFSGESWPPTEPAQRETARRLMSRLLASE